jgi:uncharacterized protein (TIGR02271 family)
MAQTSSNNTVIGVFDDYSTAERVARDLTNAGIPRESIEVKSNFMTGAAGRSTTEEEHHEGGISGFFHRLFGSDDEEHGHYAEAVRRGNAVVCVTAPSEQLDQAVEIMNSGGAVDIDRRVAAYRETGYERHDPTAPPYSYDEAIKERERYRGADQQGGSIPVVEEELQVGKRAVQRGGVRVYSHTVERPVEENITLREEHVRVERRPADRPLESGDKARMRDQSIEVTEMAEEPVVNKRARVREEVVVGKETTERTEKIRDTVRRTEVEVERLGDRGSRETSGQDYTSDFRRDYETRYASSGVPYDTVAPAYDYGYRSANDARYRGRSWSDVESDLRTDYERNNPNSSWEKTKDAVRYGWEKVTGRR